MELSQADAPLATRRCGEEAPPAALAEDAAAPEDAGTRVGDLLPSAALAADAAAGAGAGAFLAAGAVLRLAAAATCGEPWGVVIVFYMVGND